jgi:monothiol glutaredoxin
MKGTPEMPQCGFSAQAVTILKQHGVDFTARNVLSSDELRGAIKEYSDWPTIPQLYVNGEFVGGCDIMMEMNQSGDLAKLLSTK